MELDETRAQAAELMCQVYDIGNAFRQFGAAFASSYWKFEVKNEQIIGRIAIPELQGVKPVVLPLAYLDKDTLIRLIREIEQAGTS
jgi:hypothetical protein